MEVLTLARASEPIITKSSQIQCMRHTFRGAQRMKRNKAWYSGARAIMPAQRITTALDESEFEGLEDCPGTIAHSQLGKDAGDVVLHRPLRHSNSISDLAIAVASNHESQDFGLTLRKWIRGI